MRSRLSSLDSRLMSSPREPLACSVHSTRRTDTGDGSLALHRHRATRDKCAPHIHTSTDRGGAIMLLRAGGLGQALGPSTGPVAQYSPRVCFKFKIIVLLTQIWSTHQSTRACELQTDRRAARLRRPVKPIEQTRQTGFLGFRRNRSSRGITIILTC
jgi:hypothetical protein